jgi:hypothetical protein
MSGAIPVRALGAVLVWIKKSIPHAVHMKPELIAHHFILWTFPRHSRTKIIQILSLFCRAATEVHVDTMTMLPGMLSTTTLSTFCTNLS